MPLKARSVPKGYKAPATRRRLLLTTADLEDSADTPLSSEASPSLTAESIAPRGPPAINLSESLAYRATNVNHPSSYDFPTLTSFYEHFANKP